MVEPIGRVLIAAGQAGRALAAFAPELGSLTPIKGQLVTFGPRAILSEPILRGEAVYIVPQVSGVRAGATMERGSRDDVVVETTVVEGLRQAALEVLPSLAGSPYRGEAGVRAATPTAGRWSARR